jgi:hypothetical protein
MLIYLNMIDKQLLIRTRELFELLKISIYVYNLGPIYVYNVCEAFIAMYNFKLSSVSQSFLVAYKKVDIE